MQIKHTLTTTWPQTHKHTFHYRITNCSLYFFSHSHAMQTMNIRESTNVIFFIYIFMLTHTHMYTYIILHNGLNWLWIFQIGFSWWLQSIDFIVLLVYSTRTENQQNKRKISWNKDAKMPVNTKLYGTYFAYIIICCWCQVSLHFGIDLSCGFVILKPWLISSI